MQLALSLRRIPLRRPLSTASRPSLAYDAIVIGGGHNGLVAANYLAKAGSKVCVIEQRQLVGGAAVTEAIHPGFQYSRASYVFSLFRPHISADLGLYGRHGLKLLRRLPSSFTPTPERGGRSLTLGAGDAFDEANIAQFGPPSDVQGWRAYNARLERYARLARYLLDCAPPDTDLLADPSVPLRAKVEEAMRAAQIGAAALRELGVRGLPEFLAFLTSPAARTLDALFSDASALLKATLATDAVIGASVGPYTPQSGYVLLHHCMTGAWFNVVGGMGSVTSALADAARERGVDIVTGAAAKRIVLADGGSSGTGGIGGTGTSSSPLAPHIAGRRRNASWIEGDAQAAPDGPLARVAGVELADGRFLRAPLVLSSVAPTQTLDSADTARRPGLLPEAAEVLPAALRRALRSVDSSSPVVKINCALDRLPEFLCRTPGQDAGMMRLLESAARPSRVPGEVDPGDAVLRAAPLHLRGTVHFEPNMGTIDAAYRDAAAGRLSQRPLVEMTIPSVLDPSIAPPGKHVALLFCQYAPTNAAVWDAPGARDDFANRVFRVIDEFAPGFSASVLHREVLAPPDLERIFGLPGGNIFHASMGLDQLFTARPAPGAAAYRTPVAGLYLCGAGTHPGGGVMGAPGHNAAMQVLRDCGASTAKLRSLSSCPTL